MSDTPLMAVPRVDVDDERVRVTEWTFAPGARTGHHRHEYDYVVVPMTDGLLRIESATGTMHFELKKGRAYARLAGVEHDVINAGSAPLSFVEIEAKRS
jgi:quercetin dioxygenase-like cupin family protein